MGPPARIPPTRWRAAPWGDGQGVSAELVRWPDGAARFDARLSRATIERPGPFTPMPGHRRWLAVLEAEPDGLWLELAGRPWRGGVGDAVEFPGDAPVRARPTRPAAVLNLIVRDGVAWTAAMLAAGAGAPVAAGWVALHAPRGGIARVDGIDHALAPAETLVLAAAAAMQVAAVGAPLAVVRHAPP